jgi:hypothetical protein
MVRLAMRRKLPRVGLRGYEQVPRRPRLHCAHSSRRPLRGGSSRTATVQRLRRRVAGDAPLLGPLSSNARRGPRQGVGRKARLRPNG